MASIIIDYNGLIVYGKSLELSKKDEYLLLILNEKGVPAGALDIEKLKLKFMWSTDYTKYYNAIEKK